MLKQQGLAKAKTHLDTLRFHINYQSEQHMTKQKHDVNKMRSRKKIFVPGTELDIVISPV